MADILRAIVLGIIEGLTEFLPISSTGHLILAMPLLGVDEQEPRWQVFMIVCQIGAILAVLLYFWRDLWRAIVIGDAGEPRERFLPRPLATGPSDSVAPPRSAPAWANNVVTKLAVAFAPAALVGLLAHQWIEKHLEKPIPVALALIVGAAGIELIDRRFRRGGAMSVGDITLSRAFWIGVCQCLSIVWPGISRAGATIMGGMALGLTPTVATQFSFYLAIPTMLAAGVKQLWSHRAGLNADAVLLMLLGTAVAFVVALLVVDAFMRYVRRNRFTPFAIYRVLLGSAVLIWQLAR